MTREEAITRIKDHIEIHRYHERNAVKIFEALDMAIKALEQPESTRTFVELVAEYPDPELCTYKEYKGKPYYSIKYIENGETYVGYGTYNPEVLSQYLKEYFISSAKPELSGKVERILDFLDTELHPIVSPDHWNVYSELYDMISMLPSAQPDLQQTCNKLATNLQQTCNQLATDCISRQAAYDAINSETVSTNPEHFEASEKFIKFMDDAEIASFGKWQWANGFNTALTALEVAFDKLPSAQPEIIRCKDCKYCSPNGVYGCRLERFSYFDASERMYADEFCSRAERRDNDE